MADVRKKQLPNLKISVENTKSSNESEEELDFIDDTTDTVQLDEYDQSEDDGQIEKDVEFNVHIHGSELDKTKTKDRTVSRRKETISSSTASTVSTVLDKTKTRTVSRRKEPVSTAGTTSSTSASATSSSRHRSKSKEVDKDKSDKALAKKQKASDVNSSIKEKQRLSTPVLPEKRLYENKQGSFVTGIDVTTKEAQAKRDQRAQRFKIQFPAAPTSLKLDDVQSLYKSLGVHERDFDNEEKGIRGEALHLRGTDDMNTDDVFQYFSEFPARFVEWINDASCNVVWDDKVTPVRALLKLTKSHDKVEADEESKKKEKAVEKQSEKQSAPKKPREKKDSAAVDPPISNSSASKRRTSRSTEERMEVDEDELDLMVEDDDLFLTTTSAPETSAQKKGKKDQLKKGASNDKNEKGKGGGKDVPLVKVKKEKEEVRRQQRKGGENKDGGEYIDSSSSSGSSSSSSSGSSSSDSSSSSSDGSSSDSSSSDSESDDEKKSKKKTPIKTRRDADTGEVVKGRQVQDKKTRSSIPWPPGKWRLGVPCTKAKYLFIRYATKDDKKEVGAERKSQYYRKYGNPNYGGIRGLISKSRKRRMHNETVDKILKSRGPDARDALEQKRALGRLAGSLAREEGEVSNEDDIFAIVGEDQLEERIEHRPSKREANLPIERVKDLRQLLKQNTGASKKIIQEETSSAQVVGAKRPKMAIVDVEELDLDAELKQLMRDRPAKKLPHFRMHADEEEERIQARRSRNAGLLTVVKSERSEEGPSRLEGRLQLPAEPWQANRGWQREQPGQRWLGGDARFPNSEGDEEEEEEEEDADDFARALRDYRRLRNIPIPQSSIRPKITAARTSFRQPEVPADVADLTDEEEKEKEVVMTESGDLRSRLQPQAKGRRSFPSMRIEVFDEEEED